MAHPIDTTLALLHDVMTAHRQALTRGPESNAPAAISLPRSKRADLVLRLLAGVEKRVGIEVAQAPAEKLLRGLSAVDTGEIESWVSELEILPTTHPQWLALIESLTVHETYVMRDPAQLEHFAAQLPGLIAEAETSHHLRFWSVGCATGEEAYSIAALVYDAMLEAGHADGDRDRHEPRAALAGRGFGIGYFAFRPRSGARRALRDRTLVVLPRRVGARSASFSDDAGKREGTRGGASI